MARSIGMRTVPRLSVDGAVVVEQKILAGVHVGCRLIPVIDIEARCREDRRHPLQFLLIHLRVARQILAFRCGGRQGTRLLLPLGRRPVLVKEGDVDDAAHKEAKDEEDKDKADQAGQEDDDAIDVDVGEFIARASGIGVGLWGGVPPSVSLPRSWLSVGMFGLQHLLKVRIVDVDQRTLVQLVPGSTMPRADITQSGTVT